MHRSLSYVTSLHSSHLQHGTHVKFSFCDHVRTKWWQHVPILRYVPAFSGISGIFCDTTKPHFPWLQGKEFQISQANTYLKEKHNVIFCILAELDMTLQFTNVHILLISVYINVDLQIYFILKRQMTKPRQGLPFIRLFEFYNYMFIHLLLLLRYLICESFNQETKTTTFLKVKVNIKYSLSWEIFSSQMKTSTPIGAWEVELETMTDQRSNQ